MAHNNIISFLLSTLSSCSHAVVALLYPFSWQHTFIPVLPSSMIDIVCCPTPFLVGLLSSSLPKLKELPVEEVRMDSIAHMEMEVFNKFNLFFFIKSFTYWTLVRFLWWLFLKAKSGVTWTEGLLIPNRLKKLPRVKISMPASMSLEIHFCPLMDFGKLLKTFYLKDAF